MNSRTNYSVQRKTSGLIREMFKLIQRFDAYCAIIFRFTVSHAELRTQQHCKQDSQHEFPGTL